MDRTNGRSGSEAPSSSSSDFYAASAPNQHDTRAASPAIMHSTDHAATPNEHDDDGDDEASSSEMDVSMSSRASSPQSPAQPARPAVTKRKLSEVHTIPDGAIQPAQELKKRKLSTPPRQSSTRTAGLPVELWQQVFLHLPPPMLCRCLRVCRAFNTFLTDTKAAPGQKKDLPKVRVLDSEAIWTTARKAYFPNLPRPLARCSEREMLQLVGGRTCQFCDRAPIPSPATTHFNCGPGPDGLRVIWPFGIRGCGRCIENNTLKDVQILVSAAASLRFGLPYAFLTPDLNFVPEIQRQMPGGIPSHLRVAKVYYTKDIEIIVQEFENAKGFGNGAADEWRKGLHTQGKEAMADAARWEKWEGQMRLGSDLTQVLREYDPSSFPRHFGSVQSRLKGVAKLQSAVVPFGTSQPQHVIPGFQSGYSTPMQIFTPQFQQGSRPARNAHDIEEARQARRSEIERRCLELQPPLEPNVLQHTDSFQAAIQITTPLTDAAWEMLRPRILAQREDAEYAEHLRQEQLAALQAAVPSVYGDEMYTRPAREIYDKEYERAQDPLRKKLGEYTEKFTREYFSQNPTLDKDNAPTFAVKGLLNARQRYLQDMEDGLIPFPSPPTRNGSRQGSPIPEPFLSLDNMKWVFDHKIRPLTDPHRREIFICSGCVEEKKPKWFAFEGLIQHYGAKHTTNFSKGNIVVHWQTAEWPEVPPFSPNPGHWIKLEKKPADHKGHHRARNTPQTGYEGPFSAPPSGMLLSESPFFSNHPQPPQSNNGYHGDHYAYPPHQYGQGSPQAASHGMYPAALPQHPLVDLSEHAQLTTLSSNAREIWDNLEGVKDLLDCVRVHAVLFHTVQHFTDKFRNKPTLDQLTDVLASHTILTPVKSAHGLACKHCVESQTDGSASYQSYNQRIRHVKKYNISSLISHFKIMHQPGDEAAYHNWSTDMIELPELQLIGDLIRSPGMNDEKLATLAAVFPRAFPNPLPKIGHVEEPRPDAGLDKGFASRLLQQALNKKSKQPKKKGRNSSGHGRAESHDPLPEPNDDEYDPRRPIYHPDDKQEDDPGRFDTDLVRHRRGSTGAPPINSAPFNLAPDTLAALDSLNALTSRTEQTQLNDRSPSVGRTEAMSVTADNSGGPPDISSILSALTGQAKHQQTATPPMSLSTRSTSVPRHTHQDPYVHSHDVTPGSYRDNRHQAHHEPPPSTYKTSSYRGSEEPPQRYDGQDLSAALAHNARQFEQNRSQTVYASQPHTLASPLPRQQTARYQYVYEHSQPYPQPQHQSPPTYYEQPVQYVQLSPQQDRPPPPTGYQYERPTAPPQPRYFDERGRPVEIILAGAPAPVQFMPHPFEQQQRQQQRYVRQSEPAQQYGSIAAHLQPAYDEQQQHRPVYYEVSGQAPSPAAGPGQPIRYVYDDGARSSVPRG